MNLRFAQTHSIPVKNGAGPMAPRRVWGLFLALGLLLLATALTLQVHAAPPADPPPAWTIVSSPNAGEPTWLKAVAARTSNDVWAVGYHSDPAAPSPPPSGTFIQHWDGSAWSSVSAPNPGNRNELNAVAVRAANDAWAVGGYNTTNTSGPNWRPLILHWNGSTWSQVVSPELPDNNVLYGVTVVDANNAWAVGTWGYYLGFQPCIYHWDGTSWSIAYQANSFPYGAHLNSIAARTVNDVWAVGDEGITSGTTTPLTMHWNGSNWQVLPNLSPVYGGQYILYSVAMVASNDVWAAGSAASGGSTSPLTIHWNGTGWSSVTQPGGSPKPLYGVAAIAANDLWEVGVNTTSGTQTTFTVHWNGTALSDQTSPNQPGGNILYGVAGVATNDVWAVGRYSLTGNQSQTLTLHYTTGVACQPMTCSPRTPPPPPPAPKEAVSYYIQDMLTSGSPTFFSDAGKEAGIRASTPGSQSVIVILNFNKPALVDTPYGRYWGTRLLTSYTFVSLDDIEKATVQFAKGFVKGANGSSAQLILAVGTNNYQDDNLRPLSVAEYRQHGNEWGQLLGRISGDLQQYAGVIFIEGANDLEFNWSDSAHGIAWIEGYRDATQLSGYTLYNFGGCDGCYPDCGGCTLENNTILGGSNYTWQRTDAIYAIWGTGIVLQIPQIYYPSPCLSGPVCPPGTSSINQAKQWASLSLYSASHVINNHCYGPLVFEGALTGWRGSPAGTVLTPADGWKNLWTEINSNTCTSQSVLTWITDIMYQQDY